MPIPAVEHTEEVVISQAEFYAVLRAKVCAAVQVVMNAVLDAEVEAFIGAAPYARTPSRQAHRNGSYRRGLVTSVGPSVAGISRVAWTPLGLHNDDVQHLGPVARPGT